MRRVLGARCSHFTEGGHEYDRETIAHSEEINNRQEDEVFIASTFAEWRDAGELFPLVETRQSSRC